MTSKLFLIFWKIETTMNKKHYTYSDRLSIETMLNEGYSIKEIESGIIPNTVTSIAEAFSYTKYFSQDLDFQTDTSLNFYRTFENSNYNGAIKTNVPPHSLDYAFSNSTFNSSTK